MGCRSVQHVNSIALQIDCWQKNWSWKADSREGLELTVRVVNYVQVSVMWTEFENQCDLPVHLLLPYLDSISMKTLRLVCKSFRAELDKDLGWLKPRRLEVMLLIQIKDNSLHVHHSKVPKIVARIALAHKFRGLTEAGDIPQPYSNRDHSSAVRDICQSWLLSALKTVRGSSKAMVFIKLRYQANIDTWAPAETWRVWCSRKIKIAVQ